MLHVNSLLLEILIAFEMTALHNEETIQVQIIIITTIIIINTS